MAIIGLCCDHAGYELKEFVKTVLDARGLSDKDYGCYSTESCDYPDFAHQLGAALCWSEEIARLAREHNDANVLVMPGRFVANVAATSMVNAFLDTAFEGGRHQRRVNKIPLQK